MTAARRRVVAVSTVLLLVFAVGVLFLVRLVMGTPSNGNVSPITSSPQATAGAGDSGPAAVDTTGTASEHGGPDPEDNGDIRTDNDHANLGPRDDGDTRTIRTTDPGTQPPPPAVPLSSVGGIGPRVYIPAGTYMGTLYVDDAFSVQVRLVDINLSQPGNELILYEPAGEDVTRCQRHTVEAGETGPLCSVEIQASESAEPGEHRGKLELVLEATCISKSGRPCQKLSKDFAPSPDNPIEVIWYESFSVYVEKLDFNEEESSSPTTEPPSATVGTPSPTAEPTP